MVQLDSNRAPLSGLDSSLLESQININKKAMEEIDALKKERDEIMAMKEKLMKEKEMMVLKLTRSNEQLSYLKKKFEKKSGVDTEQAQDQTDEQKN